MKNLTLILIVLFAAQTGFGQITKDNWTNIAVVNNFVNWKDSVKESYSIKKLDGKYYSFNDTNLVLKNVVDSIATLVFSSLDNNFDINDPLKMFNRDSAWIVDNSENLWSQYKIESGLLIKPKYDSIAIGVLNNYTITKNLISKLTGNGFYNNKKSPNYVSVLFYNESDTLIIETTSRYCYMLPFEVNNKPVYNANLSNAISLFIDYEGWKNKYLMKGIAFDYFLIENIYYSFIEDEIEFKQVKDKYPKQLIKLSNKFQVEYAEASMLGSIEFGGNMGRNCLELILKDSIISKNIRFTPIFGRRVVLHSITPLLKSKEKIIHQIESNPIYQYAKSNNVTMDIHFVNSKSLSNTAKRNFIEDAKKANLKSEVYSGKFKDAVFITLWETRHEERSSSRWILLKNGTNILWDFTGKFLMNLPKEDLKEQGYVCKPISNEKLK
jgi:hypothetical protein